MKLRRTSFAYSLKIALFSALLGFCYSITTQADSAAPRSIDAPAAPRVVGSSSMRFTNARSLLFPADFDVGDSFYGSVITRYITVAGGVRPYSFTSVNLTALLGANSTLAVMASGCLMGSVTVNTFSTDIAFMVSATDSTELQARDKTLPLTNSTPASKFHLTLYAGGPQSFRFAVDRLNDGVLGQSYLAKIDAVGGKGGTTYSILPGTVTFNSAPFGTGSSLEAMGLTLANDGTLYGRALKAGLIGFTVRAKDGLNRIAKSRTVATVQDQAVNFNIEDTAVTSSDSTLLSVNIKGNTAKLNTDTIQFSAKYNLGGMGQAGLNGSPFAFVLGGNTYAGFLDSTGKVGTALKRPLVLADGSTMTAVVDAINGTIKGKIVKSNLSSTIDAINIADRSTKRLAVGILLCNFVVAADVLDFSAKHANSKYSLSYSIGHLGTPLAGNFQMYNIRSKDGNDIAGNPGTAWTADLIMVPRNGIDDNAGFSNLAGVQIRINRNFTQDLPVSAFQVDAKGNLVYANKTSQTGIKTFTIKNGVFAAHLETYPISAGLTTIPPASDATATVLTTFFNLAIDVNRVAPNPSFHGECSKVILKEFLNPDPKHPHFNNKWIDRAHKRP